MIKIENVVLPSPEQMDFIIEGMRNSIGVYEKGDSGTCLKTLPCHSCHESKDNCKENIDTGKFIFGKDDYTHILVLARIDTDKYYKILRMIPVYMSITAPLYWWNEMDVFKINTIVNYPNNYKQTRHVMTNYEVLSIIYDSHKWNTSDEWKTFCNWIESLPYSGLIT